MNHHGNPAGPVRGWSHKQPAFNVLLKPKKWFSSFSGSHSLFKPGHQINTAHSRVPKAACDRHLLASPHVAPMGHRLSNSAGAFD